MKINLLMLLLPFLGWTLHSEEIWVSSPEEIEAAMNFVQPGDTLTMRNGHWTDVKIDFDGDGEENKPILLRAQTPGQVIIDGRSSLRIGGSYLVVDGLLFTNGYPSKSSHVIQFRTSDSRKAKHCRLTNTAIINYNPPSINTRYFWVSLYGEHNRVDHCFFSGQNHSGVTVVAWLNNDANYHLIDHNYFGDRPAGPDNGWETIRIGTSDKSGTNSRTTVEWNYFYRCDGEIEIISSKSNENIFRNNTFVDCNGQLTLRHGKRNWVEGNFFFGYNASGSSGVRIIDRDHVVINNYFAGLNGDGFQAAVAFMNGVPDSPLNRYFQVINALVAFNTFVDCRNPFDIGVGSDAERTLVPDSCIIANNLVYSTNAATQVDYIDTPTHLTYEGNIMFGAELGIPQTPGINEIDPKLVLSDDGLFRPDAESPAINAAVGAYPQVRFDMEGQSRTDSLKDIGADEVSDEPATIRPLTRDDIVPAWVEDVISAVERRDNSAPKAFVLNQNYPNPFNPSTKITYSLPRQSQVRITVFNTTGQKIRTLYEGFQRAGTHTLIWQPEGIATGIYFYALEIGESRIVRKALFVK